MASLFELRGISEAALSPMVVVRAHIIVPGSSVRPRISTGSVGSKKKKAPNPFVSVALRIERNESEGIKIIHHSKSYYPYLIQTQSLLGIAHPAEYNH